MNIHDKIIAVTGGGSGIGRALVLALLRQGATVAAVDINEQTLQETKSMAGKKSDCVSTHLVNITDKAAVAKLPEQIMAAHGTIDGLINNAGITNRLSK